LLRKQEYEEIAKKNPLEAINYLQTKLSDIIDHSDPKQLKEVGGQILDSFGTK
jgi:hypothetical protein